MIRKYCPLQSDQFEDSTASNSTQDMESSDDNEESMSLFSEPSQVDDSFVAELESRNQKVSQSVSVYNNYNCQVITKAMFAKVLDRGEAVKILKNMFNVKQGHLTDLTPAQALEILVKKLINGKYAAISNSALDPKKLRIADILILKKVTL